MHGMIWYDTAMHHACHKEITQFAPFGHFCKVLGHGPRSLAIHSNSWTLAVFSLTTERQGSRSVQGEICLVSDLCAIHAFRIV